MARIARLLLAARAVLGRLDDSNRRLATNIAHMVVVPAIGLLHACIAGAMA